MGFIKFFFRALPWLLVLGFVLFFAIGGTDWLGKNNEQPVELEKVSLKPVLEEVIQMGKLELVKYRFRDVLKYKQREPSRFIPDKEILLLLSGEAVGCIDLEKMTAEDIVEVGDTLLVTLPNPEICYTKINHDSTEVYDVSLIKIFDKTHLLKEAYRLADLRAETLAKDSNILSQTRENGILVLKPLFERLSGKTVLISYRPEPVSISREIKSPQP